MLMAAWQNVLILFFFKSLKRLFNAVQCSLMVLAIIPFAGVHGNGNLCDVHVIGIVDKCLSETASKPCQPPKRASEDDW
jgi:hypothetical protein